jgi:SAM-dependent methyltransferase
VVEGIPVLLGKELAATHPYRDATLRAVEGRSRPEVAVHQPSLYGTIDPFVQEEIVRTNGNLYRHLHGRLPRYPIPALRLPPGEGRALLDVGCNWGRWTLAAAGAGYRAVGVDPWIEAARAGQRVARQLGRDVAFVVGDARQLPFLDGSFEAAFSYSVLQHFDKSDARVGLAEMARVTSVGGTVLVQMPNLLGLRQAYNFARQRLRRDQNPFRVRYWTHGELRRVFEELVGPSTVSVDGYFSLNPQGTDLDLLPPRYRWVIRASEALRHLSSTVPPLRLVADSLYVQSTNAAAFRRRLKG